MTERELYILGEQTVQCVYPERSERLGSPFERVPMDKVRDGLWKVPDDPNSPKVNIIRAEAWLS